MTAISSGDPTSIGRYELSSSLGVGGFATVYRAYDPALAADVAVKVLLPHIAANPSLRERFLQEARLLRRVDSTNLVKVYDLGELEDGRPYFVMELAEGGALTDRLHGTVDAESVGHVIDAMANALAALHAASIVHRDLKPDNLLIAGTPTTTGTRLGDALIGPGERLLVGDLGLAKDQARTGAGPTVTGGTPFYRPPEQMTPGAEITAAADVYAASAVLWFLLTGSHPPETQAIPGQLPSIPMAWQPLMERGLHADPTLRYATIGEWAAEARTALAASSVSGFSTVQVGESTELCPYKGMAAFQPEDAGLFFGRDDIVDTLVARMQNHAVTVIGGASGSGKSSLMRAGLLPRISRGAIAGSQQWRIALFNPGSDAIGELVHQLRKLRTDPPAGSADASARPVGYESLDRSDLPHGARRWLDDGPSTLLAIDQFEEVFTLNPGRADRELFLQTLAVMTESEHSKIRVVVAMRADFYGTSTAFPWLNERLNENQILVGPMSRQGLRDAITIPAQRAGLQLEDGLADTILDDFGAGSEALPLLGHALMETWIRRRGSRMTLEGYRSAGGVSGAIAQRAEEVFTQLSPEEQATARHLLLQLITPGEGTPDTRRRLRRDALGVDDELADVAETLASARLLTVDDEAIEVAHEALIQSWPRLRTWIDENREALQTRRRVGAAAAEWVDQNWSPDVLYRGAQLTAALDWFDAHGDELDSDGVEFLDASRHAREQAREQRAAAEARGRRNRRNAFAALSVLTVAALAASVIAVVNLRQSQASQRMAVDQQVQALAAAAAANADDESILAIGQALESMARSDESIVDARVALVDARVALDRNRWQPQPFGAPVTVGDSRSVAVTPDSSRFITGDLSGQVVFWDRVSRSAVHRVDAHDRGVTSLDVSPDGRWLISSGRLRVNLWDLEASEPQPVLLHVSDSPESDNIWAGAFSPDGSVVGIASESEGATFVDRATGQEIANTPGDDMVSIAFLDDDRAVVGEGTGLLRIVDPRTGSVIGQPESVGNNTDIWGLEVDLDRRLLVTGSSDNVVRTWTIEPDGLEPLATIDAPSVADPKGLVITRDGTEVLLGSADGLLYRADLTSGELIAGGVSVRRHTDAMSGLVATADGWMVSLADDQHVQVWRYIQDDAQINEPLIRTEAVADLALSPSSELLAAATPAATIVHRADTGEPLVELSGQHETMMFVDDQYAVTGSASGELQLWDVDFGLVVAENVGHGGQPVQALAVSHDGRFVVSGGVDGSVVLWSSTDLTQVRSLTNHSAQVTGVGFTGDDETVVSIGWDQMIRFTATDGGGESRSVPITIDGPQSLAVHPSAERLAVGGSTEQVDIMDFDGRILNLVAPHRGGVWDLAVSADGLTLVASSRRPGEVRLWDWETGERLGPTFGADDPADSETEADVVIAPGGTVFWSSSAGVVRRIDVLDPAVGCAISNDVMDAPMLEQTLSGDTLVSCR